MPLISFMMNKQEQIQEWQTRSASGLLSTCLIFPTGACMWWSFNSNQDGNYIVLYTIQTYNAITALALWSGKVWEEQLLPSGYLCSSFSRACTCLHFFSASHLPASCCPNPASPTFVSPPPLSAAYLVPMLCDYLSALCFTFLVSLLTFHSLSPSFPHYEDLVIFFQRNILFTPFTF